jgi:ABC-2 type transport system permease protein
MGTIWPIFKREFRSYFRSPIAYIFISAFLIVSGWFFYQTFFVLDYASMRNYFDILPWLFLIFSSLYPWSPCASGLRSGSWGRWRC